MLGVIAWVSVCLIIAGLSGPKADATSKRLWVLSGLAGLVSAVGLSETVKSEVQAQEQQLDNLVSEARTDILTGLANRRSFNEQIDRWWVQGKRQGNLLSLLIVDVDYFKEFNDNFGHQVGDELLQTIAHVLRSAMREIDLVARYGGDEFAVLLPGTSLSEAVMAAERLRAAVTSYRFALAEAQIQVTVSVGLAGLIPADQQPDELVMRADACLYAAKKAGRNCAYFHNGETCQPIEPVPQAPDCHESHLSMA